MSIALTFRGLEELRSCTAVPRRKWLIPSIEDELRRIGGLVMLEERFRCENGTLRVLTYNSDLMKFSLEAEAEVIKV